MSTQTELNSEDLRKLTDASIKFSSQMKLIAEVFDNAAEILRNFNIKTSNLNNGEITLYGSAYTVISLFLNILIQIDFIHGGSNEIWQILYSC